MEYFVYMTNDCNLHCEYCSVLLDSAKHGIPLRPNYSDDKLINLIAKIQKVQNDSKVSIYLFGGEPSLEYMASLRLVNAVNDSLPQYSLQFILHTNGLLLNKIPSELLDQLTAIICSINYEKIPHYMFAESYFAKVLNNIILTKKRKAIVTIGRLTITEKTSLYTEVLQCAHFFDYIYWQIENKSEFNNYKNFYNTYTYEINITFMYWLRYLQNGILLKYVPFMAAMRFLLFKDRSDTEFSCGYGAGMIYIQTDGTCYACSDSVECGDHYIGDVNEGVTLLRPSLLDLRCVNCSYRFLCMGRCGRMHKEFTKKQVSRYCALNKYMYRLFIENKASLEDTITRYPSLVDELKKKDLDLTEFTP